MNKAKWRN